MRRVRAGAATAAVGVLLSGITVLTGGPAAAGPPGGGAGPAAVTLVNGAGRTLRVPAVTTAGTAPAAGAAGSSGHAGAGKGDAAAGGADTQSLIGPDNRYREPSTTAYPASTVVRFHSRTLGECTGFMVSRDTVVTAGHCVYNNGVWAADFTVTPGQYAPAGTPFGSCTGSTGDVWTNSHWHATLDWQWDYGMVKLRCDIGYATGWMGYWYDPGQSLVGQYFYSPGYGFGLGYGEMWNSYDRVFAQHERVLEHDNDTSAGMSGGPLYRYRQPYEGLCAGWCITAIHTRGNGGNGHNWAQRYTAEVVGVIAYVVNLP